MSSFIVRHCSVEIGTDDLQCWGTDGEKQREKDVTEAECHSESEG